MELDFMLHAFPLKIALEKASANVQMELINLECDTDLIQTFLETKLQDFYS
jgi:hypothetical protein